MKGWILRSYPISAQIYGILRFQIITTHFLTLIEQHLPESGNILYMGCGFGMVTIYFAMRRPRCNFIGVDLNPGRIRVATHAAKTLQVKNVQFTSENVRDYEFPNPLNGAYCIDLLHHLSSATGDCLIQRLFEQLEPGGTLVIKDIDTRPRAMLYFTFVLDLIMSPREKPHYRSIASLRSLLSRIGFVSIDSLSLRNILPFLHFLLVAQKPIPVEINQETCTK